MIDIPHAAVIQSIKSPCICHFKDTNHPKTSPCHFYVVIPINPSSEVILCIITSKVEKKKNYYKRNIKALDGLVAINQKIFPFLNKASVVDCNNAELIPKNIFEKRVDPSHQLTIKLCSLDAHILKKIKDGIKASPLVSPYLKSLL